MTAGRNHPAYPGHGQPATPSRGPRVKVEGEPNYIKNKGTITNRVFNKTGPITSSPRPQPRCPTEDSKSNQKAGWYGTVSPLLNGSCAPQPSSVHSRVKPEAEATAYMSRGPRMKVIVNEYARSGPSPRAARVKPEGEKIAALSQGGRMTSLFHKFGHHSVPRLKLKIGPALENQRSKQVGDTLYKYGQFTAGPRPQPRVRSEGQDNAELNKGKQMDSIFKMYGRCPLTSAVPRVRPEGEPNAFLGTGVRMSRLLHALMNVPGTPRPAPRTTSSQARANALKGRGSMDLIFKNIAQKTFLHVPGQQTRQYLRAGMA